MVEQTETFEAEKRARTLYVRFPKLIKDDKEVMSIFPENVIVKLPRQRSKCCHVTFPTINERTKCLKTMKNKLVDGKKIIMMSVTEKSLDKRKTKKIERKKESQKKVTIPVPKSDVPVVQALYVSNIPIGTTITEVKEAFPGCVTLAFLKGIPGKLRVAIVKMEKIQQAMAYLKKEIPAPKISGNELKIRPYKKKSKAKRKKQKNLMEVSQTSENSDSEVKSEAEEDEEEGEGKERKNNLPKIEQESDDSDIEVKSESEEESDG